jgi:hypothetical protein
MQIQRCACLNSRSRISSRSQIIWYISKFQNRNTAYWIWRFHSNDYEEFCNLWCNAMYISRSSLTFRRNMLPLCFGSKSNPSKKPTRCRLVSCRAYSLTLKMEMICSYKTSVDFYWIIQQFSANIWANMIETSVTN